MSFINLARYIGESEAHLGYMSETRVYRDHNFQIICASSLMGMMMVAIIVPAFPKIIEVLGATEESIGLLITMFTLPSLIFTPLGGIMGDRLGRKRTLVASLFLSGIFGGSCALARDFNTLLILRVLQGIGAAPSMGVSVAILGDIFSGQRRAEAMSLNTSVMYVGYIVYPLIGGALAGLGWNYPFLPFLISIPMGLINLIFLHCPEPQNKQALKDYLRDAIRYVKSLKVLWLFLATVITYILLYGAYLVYFSLFLERRFQASPFIIGLSISSIGLLTTIVSFQVGWLSKKLSLVSLIAGAFVIYAFAMVIIPAIPNLWLCLLPAIFFGMAHGLNLPCQSIIAASVAPLEHRASFMSIQGTMIILGMTIGPPIMGLAFGLTNLNITFFIAAIIALIIPVTAMIIGRQKLSAS